MIISVILLVIVAAVAYFASNEGAWGAALIFLSVLFSGLLAMNFFEPLAAALDGSMGKHADFVALMGLFIVSVLLMRLFADYLAPTQIELPGLVYDIGRFGFGAAAGYITMAFMLTAVHTAPVPREFLDFTPERMNLFDVHAPDRAWLGFTQHVSEKMMGSKVVFDGPKYKMPGMSQPNAWPSFTIRYAARREAAAGRPAGAAGPTMNAGPAANDQPATKPPSGGGF